MCIANRVDLVESCGIDVRKVAVDVACYSCGCSHVSGSSMWSGKELWLCAKVLAGARIGPCTASHMVVVSLLPCRVALTPEQWLYSYEVSVRGSHVVDWDVRFHVSAETDT